MTSLTDVNVEEGKVEVEVFNKTEAALSELRKKYDVIPDATTEEGYTFVKEGVKELTTYRTSLDAERKRIKAPYLEAGRIIDAEAKRITEELVKLEDPLKAAKKEVDDREKRLKEERLRRLNQRIQEIRDFVTNARGKDSATIAGMIEQVDAIDTSQDFFELSKEAAEARAKTLEQLEEIFSDRLEHEAAKRQAEEQAAEMRRRERAQEIDSKINTIRLTPSSFIGASAEKLRNKIASMETHGILPDAYDDRAEEAQAAHDQVIGQLRAMLSQAELVEKAERDQEERRKAEEQAKANAQESAEHTAKGLEEALAPKVVGVDMAAGPDETVTHEVLPDIYQEEAEPVQEGRVELRISVPRSQASAVKSVLLDQFPAEVTDDFIFIR